MKGDERVESDQLNLKSEIAVRCVSRLLGHFDSSTVVRGTHVEILVNVYTERMRAGIHHYKIKLTT